MLKKIAIIVILSTFSSWCLLAAEYQVKDKIIKEYTLGGTVRDRFEKVIKTLPLDPYQEPLTYQFISGNILKKLLPETVISTILDMKTENGPDLIIMHNFPVDSFIPRTPRDGARPPVNRVSKPCQKNGKGFVSEAGLLAVGHLLDAEPVYEKEEKDGTVINQIIPVNDKKHEVQHSSFGSKQEFLPHTENVYQVPPLKYFSLLCLRGDPKVATRIIFADDIVAYIKNNYPTKYESILKILGEKQFIMASGPSFENARIENTLPVFEPHTNGELIFRLNLNPGRTTGITEEAEEIITFLRTIITSKEFKEKYSKSIHLKKGDLILFKNWRVMHARDSFTIDPNNWRWLQRCYFMAK